MAGHIVTTLDPFEDPPVDFSRYQHDLKSKITLLITRFFVPGMLSFQFQSIKDSRADNVSRT